MKNLEELEKQYNEAKIQMDWQKMAAIMLLVYPEPDVQPPAKHKAKIKPLQA